MNTPTYDAMANDPLRVLRKAQLLVADEYNDHRAIGAKMILGEDVQIVDFTRGLNGCWTVILGTMLEDGSDRQYQVQYDAGKERAYVNTFKLQRISCVYDNGDPTHNWSQEY